MKIYERFNYAVVCVCECNEKVARELEREYGETQAMEIVSRVGRLDREGGSLRASR